MTDDRTELDPLAAEARKALAQPEPEGAAPQPVDGEVAELVTWLRERGQERETLHLPGAELSKQLRTAPFLLTRAADLLERVARRPKQPNLKAQALAALSRADKDALTNPLTGEVVALRTILSKEQSNTIRRALKQLND